MINQDQKQQIVQALGEYVSHIGSQNKASKALDVSGATLSNMQNGNWDSIADEMWRKVAAGIGHSEQEWVNVRTRDLALIHKNLHDAQMNSMVFGVIGSAGSGKSLALKEYARDTKRVYLLSCNEFWNRKFFLSELLATMGRDYSGLTVAEMMGEAVRSLKSQDKPLIILDEADKLTDQVLYFFITLYNQLEDQCGIVLCATDHLSKRIRRGLKLNKKGYQEIFSRLGRKFIELHGVGSTDVAQVCIANGITAPADIKTVFEDCDYDLRRVKRKIHSIKIKQQQQAA